MNDTADILVLNAGSSSIKFLWIAMPAERRLTQGRLQGIGGEAASLELTLGENRPIHHTLSAPDHVAGLAGIFERLTEFGLVEGLGSCHGVGHRVVHGGESFTGAVRIDPSVIERLGQLRHLAPLHNEINLSGVRAVEKHLPGVPQVAVFDTAFHHDLPERARLYALPRALQVQQQIRRYGFHGLSHQYVTAAALVQGYGQCQGAAARPADRLPALRTSPRGRQAGDTRLALALLIE